MTDLTTDLDQLATEVVRALPPLDAGERRVGRAIYRLMVAGTPATPAHLAQTTGMAVAAVAEVLA